MYHELRGIIIGPDKNIQSLDALAIRLCIQYDFEQSMSISYGRSIHTHLLLIIANTRLYVSIIIICPQVHFIGST